MWSHELERCGCEEDCTTVVVKVIGEDGEELTTAPVLKLGEERNEDWYEAAVGVALGMIGGGCKQ